jgi:hypothetical protein
VADRDVSGASPAIPFALDLRTVSSSVVITCSLEHSQGVVSVYSRLYLQEHLHHNCILRKPFCKAATLLDYCCN